MRLNKVSELIHNSTNHQNLESAGVSVHFQEIIDLVTVSFYLRRIFLIFRRVIWVIYVLFAQMSWSGVQDNGDYEAVPGSDFVISRVAFRDNSSKYYINDRGSNFTEVTKLLKGKGVDLDNNRFLILQVWNFICLFLFVWVDK